MSQVVELGWPTALKDLPMAEQHKQTLITHWDMLHQDFRIV